MSDYKISIITPYHNTKQSLFEGCVASLMEQTIGFENIEWVLVLHNCEEDYVRYVSEKLGQYDNVKLHEVYNDSYGASSPRNIGLSLATAPYVAFMDSDDKYRPDALERIVGYLSRFNAQIVVFRREYELEIPNLTPIAITVPWDKTREVIVMDKEDGIENRTYNDFPVFITDRAFDRQFLIDNDMSFDESIMIGEDCHFNLKAIYLAQRICYLPQLIGYNYLINSGSILNNEKTDEEVLRVIDNNIAILERAIRYGFYANHIILAMCFSLSLCLMSQNLSMEVREKAKEEMQPYLAMTSPVPYGRFLEPLRNAVNNLPYEILMHPERFSPDRCPHRMLRKLSPLDKILRLNRDTEYGKRFHFGDILSERGYQSQVPLSEIPTYQPLIDLERSIGDTCIYSSQAPRWYIERPDGNLLPVSDQQAQSYEEGFESLLHGDVILVWSEQDPPLTAGNNGILISNPYGIALSHYFDKYRFADRGRKLFTVPAEILLHEGNARNRRYIQTLLSVANRDLDQIVDFSDLNQKGFDSMFSSATISQMADVIETGKVPEELMLSPFQMLTIPAFLAPNPDRAEELREIAKTGEKIRISDIWPNLREITVVASRPADAWPTDIDGIPVTHSYLMTEAGIIGLPTDRTGCYELNIDAIFYEFVTDGFVPGEERPMLIDQLRIGDRVTPVVTTDAGLYRCRLDFAIEVVDITDGRLLFSGV